MVGVVRRFDGVAEGVDLVLVGHVAVVGADDPALRCFLLAQPLGLGEVVIEDVAGGDVTTLCDQLPGQCPSHAGAAAGDDRQFAAEILHLLRPLCLMRRWSPSMPVCSSA